MRKREGARAYDAIRQHNELPRRLVVLQVVLEVVQRSSSFACGLGVFRVGFRG